MRHISRRVRPFSTRRPRLTRRPTRWRQLVLAPEDARIRPEQVAQQVAPCATRSQACEIIRKDWRRRPDLNRGWRFCRPLAKPRSPGKRSSRQRSRRRLGFVNLMDALKKSLDAVSATKKKPAKAVGGSATRREAQTRVRTSDAEDDGDGRHGQSLTKAAIAHRLRRTQKWPALGRPFRLIWTDAPRKVAGGSSLTTA